MYVHPDLADKTRNIFELKGKSIKKNLRLDTSGKFQNDSKALVNESYTIS